MKNRIIKFRAWYKGDECMDEPPRMFYNIQNCYDGGSEFMGRGSFGSFLNDDDFKVMQYTGLKDKNGKEIWEGDYISMGGSGKHEVFFRDGSFMYWIDKVSYLELSQSCFFDDFEVIGNIFENPELLKTTK